MDQNSLIQSPPSQVRWLKIIATSHNIKKQQLQNHRLLACSKVAELKKMKVIVQYKVTQIHLYSPGEYMMRA